MEDDRRTGRHMPEDGYTVRSTHEPNGSGELIVTNER